MHRGPCWSVFDAVADAAAAAAAAGIGDAVAVAAVVDGPVVDGVVAADCACSAEPAVAADNRPCWLCVHNRCCWRRP